MVLLLSATPYKPYTTNQEIAESHKDTHKHDFDVLMEFLYERSEGFQEIWAGHSNALLHLQSKPFDVVVAAKRRAEDALYRAMCRTERLSEDIIDTQTWRRVLLWCAHVSPGGICQVVSLSSLDDVALSAEEEDLRDSREIPGGIQSSVGAIIARRPRGEGF